MPARVTTGPYDAAVSGVVMHDAQAWLAAVKVAHVCIELPTVKQLWK